MDIAIKPGSVPHRINPQSQGVSPVAILTTTTVDAPTGEPLSVRFGPKGAPAVHGTGQSQAVRKDGAPALVLLCRPQDTGRPCGDTAASRTGQPFTGQALQRTAAIMTAGCQ